MLKHRISSTWSIINFCFHALISVWTGEALIIKSRKRKNVTISVQHLLRYHEGDEVSIKDLPYVATVLKSDKDSYSVKIPKEAISEGYGSIESVPLSPSPDKAGYNFRYEN